MPLVNMKKMLAAAAAGHYAVGAFNILDYNSMRAVVETATELESPVIIQTSVKTVLFWGYDAISSWAVQLSKAPIPIALHLDHCKDLDILKNCINAGWTSVMFDGSSMPYEENLHKTKQAVELAKKKDISVEAELGDIVGVEDDIHVKEQDAHLADPEQSERFCAETGIDCFAPAVGTAHGVYAGEPKVAFDLIENIANRTQTPLALHGGTGLSEEVFHKSIALGCAKVNISTQLKYAHIDGFVNEFIETKKYDPLKPLGAQLAALKQAVKENISLFGSVEKCKQEK